MDLFDYMDEETIDYSKLEGIRLKKLEIYNWGTFDKFVWKYTPDGNTSLLTGQSGSGKSTLVDALTTLLVAPKKTTYNKAADASAKERNTKSYVLGYYGQKFDVEGKGKQECLRSTDNYSVILGTFEDKVEKSIMTLAIFFWFKDKEKPPERFYAVSKTELFIAKDFANFNKDSKILRENLKAQGVIIFDKFKSYSEYYRKNMNDLSEQAIDLFQQTISMKKVENLNEFVRSSMLEKEDVEEKIERILKHYDNLSATYNSVIKVKDQINRLKPISEAGVKYTEKEAEKIELDLASQSMECWFAIKTLNILEDDIEEVKKSLNEIKSESEKKRKRKEFVESNIIDTKSEININGGNEIYRLKREIEHCQEELSRRNTDLLKYNTEANKVKLKEATSFSIYNDNCIQIPKMIDEIDIQVNLINSTLSDIDIKLNELELEKENYNKEIKSLNSRRSNIPSHLIELRKKICDHLQISEELLPFVGELLEVEESQLHWEGAVERLTNSFALSLLVKENYYDEVARWVNNQSLGTKFIYYKVSKKEKAKILSHVSENCVASKLKVKNDTNFSKWVTEEIFERFSHICCEDIEEFKKQQKAITLGGQIKSRERHEKDDRKTLSDRTKFVLGFSNKKKLEAIEKLVQKCNEELKILNTRKDEYIKNRDNYSKQQRILEILKTFDSFDKIDINRIQENISDYKERISQLQHSNDKLAVLEKTLIHLEIEKKTLNEEITNLDRLFGENDNKLSLLEQRYNENKEKLSLETSQHKTVYDFLEKNYQKYVGDIQISVGNVEQLEKSYKTKITNKISLIQEETASIRTEIEKNMLSFLSLYSNETSFMTTSINSLKEYNNLLKQLEFHNLPKFQEEFKQELQSKIIQEIVIFSRLLESNSNSIENRIKQINASLHTIDYNPNRYITLICERTSEATIRDFKIQLKACTEGIMSGIGDDEIAESKFIQIKKILEKFKGREGSTAVDKSWTLKVTDVRNWFVFSASERWRDSNEEYEHYSDSDGKSGGQKEKLAYTILAASLAYNYKLSKDSKGVKSNFRLVVIDEAFLKSSDESATYGLNLFRKMDFQLIVVTPLLKIRTIEPFISHVGYVSYSDIDHRSKLNDISIEVFTEKRKEMEDKGII